MLSLYLEKSAASLQTLTAHLSAGDAPSADVQGIALQLRGSSATVGAPRVAAACAALYDAADATAARLMLDTLQVKLGKARRLRLRRRLT